MDPNLLARLPLWFGILLFSTTCHEAAHAWVARLGGDDTAYAGGQVSLDPIPHVRRHPIGMIVVPLVSYFLVGGSWMLGWASAPYDPIWAGRYPRRSAWMSLAGPTANLLLAVSAGLAIFAGAQLGYFEAPSSASTTRMVAMAGGGESFATLALSIVLVLNLLLFVFNLLPAPPLDGSAAIGLLLPEEWFRRWRELCAEPYVQMLGFIVAWNLFDVVWGPVFSAALFLLYPDVSYR